MLDFKFLQTVKIGIKDICIVKAAEKPKVR